MHARHFQLFATPWTIAHQAPLSVGFSRQEHWSGLPFPPPGDSPNRGIEPIYPASPALAGGFFTSEPLGKHSLSVEMDKYTNQLGGFFTSEPLGKHSLSVEMDKYTNQLGRFFTSEPLGKHSLSVEMDKYTNQFRKRCSVTSSVMKSSVARAEVRCPLGWGEPRRPF